MSRFLVENAFRGFGSTAAEDFCFLTLFAKLDCNFFKTLVDYETCLTIFDFDLSLDLGVLVFLTNICEIDAIMETEFLCFPDMSPLAS